LSLKVKTERVGSRGGIVVENDFEEENLAMTEFQAAGKKSRAD
jgi:hypothetical protein